MATKKAKSDASVKRKAKTTASRSKTTASRSHARSTAARESSGAAASTQRRSSAATTTNDHDQIRSWAEKRGGQPACVKGTGGKNDIGMLRIDFPGYSGEETLQHIGWDEWFEKFDERQLALLYQEETAGGARSNFNKLISRTGASGAKTKAAAPKTRTAGGSS
ncbi:MAG: hypothetical protein ACM336_12860 [Acidobacteriota bacterium]